MERQRQTQDPHGASTVFRVTGDDGVTRYDSNERVSVRDEVTDGGLSEVPTDEEPDYDPPEK
jgi:hypothetical protein